MFESNLKVQDDCESVFIFHLFPLKGIYFTVLQQRPDRDMQQVTSAQITAIHTKY